MTSSKKVVILGAGGLAREVNWLIQAINRDPRTAIRYEVGGYVVTDLNRLSARDSKNEVLGDYSWLKSHRNEWNALALGIGIPDYRIKVAGEIGDLFGEVDWPTFIHPSVQYEASTCQLAKGVCVASNSILTVGVKVEAFAFINLACTVGHEARIGSGSVLNPSVNISGGVEVGNEVLVGTGAQILQYLKIGNGAIVGAGSVVTKDVAPNTTVVGIPAKSLAR